MARVYNQLLEKYPLTTKATTSGTLFSIGDFFTQLSTPSFTQSSKRNSSIGRGILISSLWASAISRLLYISGTAASCPVLPPKYSHRPSANLCGCSDRCYSTS